MTWTGDCIGDGQINPQSEIIASGTVGSLHSFLSSIWSSLSYRNRKIKSCSRRTPLGTTVVHTVLLSISGFYREMAGASFTWPKYQEKDDKDAHIESLSPSLSLSRFMFIFPKRNFDLEQERRR